MSLGVAPCEEVVNKHRKPFPLDSSKPLRDWAQIPISQFTHTSLSCVNTRDADELLPPHLWETVLYSNVVEMSSHSSQGYSAGKQWKSPSRTGHSAQKKASALGTGGSSSPALSLFSCSKSSFFTPAPVLLVLFITFLLLLRPFSFSSLSSSPPSCFSTSLCPSYSSLRTYRHLFPLERIRYIMLSTWPNSTYEV